ncbi:MAG: stage III sporulation protein AA [Lachnospiraceae bacterium]|nr:stage III sporulation protein AA [Lachnospiraceae bacterium]
MATDQEVWNLMPLHLRQMLTKSRISFDQLTELRIRLGYPMIVKYSGKEYYLDASGRLLPDSDNAYIITKEDIRSIVDVISHYSLYAFEEELRQGYLTVNGGHRIGMAGKVVLEHGQIKTIRNITYLNIRIAHQILGCARKLHKLLHDDSGYKHTLIISPPGCGKTTLLRDLIRLASEGNEGIHGVTVGVVDERSEIAACYQGIPQLDVGCRTDVLDGCPKASGMILLLRSMTPDVIAVDEIGSPEDYEAIRYVLNAGCAIFATVHGISLEEIGNRPVVSRMLSERIFERYVILSNRKGIGTIERVLDDQGNACD